MRRCWPSATALDGVKDGVITDPPACNIDFAKIQCKAGDQPDCLTASQVKYIRADYAGSRNPRTGELLVSGPFARLRSCAADAGTLEAGGTRPSGFWRYFVFDDPKWDWPQLRLRQGRGLRGQEDRAR